jgi:uncharacterized protein YbaA (DUF1428 family)
MRYVDGYVIPVSRKKLGAYMKMAKKASVIFREHGALEVRECAGDDFKTPCGLAFPKAMKLKGGEVPVFSWIVYRSKADRNRVNARVMKDKRMNSLMDPKDMSFDMNRMVYGGFNVVVDA